MFSGWHRLALCIGAWIPTWGHFTFSTAERSPAAGALALFHCTWDDLGLGMLGKCWENGKMGEICCSV